MSTREDDEQAAQAALASLQVKQARQAQEVLLERAAQGHADARSVLDRLTLLVALGLYAEPREDTRAEVFELLRPYML